MLEVSPHTCPSHHQTTKQQSTMMLSMTEDNQFGKVTSTDAETSSLTEIVPKKSAQTPSSKIDADDGDLPKKDNDITQKVKVMHEILDRKLKKAEEQKSYLFQERASKRRSFNSLRRTLSSNNKSELGDESTLEQMRRQLEALREEKDHVEEEIEKTQLRLEELTIIKKTPEEKAQRLDELCSLVTKEFASRRKLSFEA
jgi:chromosome segregation ATPase